MTEALQRLVARMHCPYCGSDLAIERLVPDFDEVLGNAVLRCECYRYPVLDGIPVLRQQSPVGTHDDPVVALVDSGDVPGALRTAMGLVAVTTPVRRAGIRSWLGLKPHGRGRSSTNQPDPLAGADFGSALRALKPRMFADYLYYRHSNQSFMTASILACLLRELDVPESVGRPGVARSKVLDLSCGLGHTTFLLGALFPDLDVVAVDWDFASLRLARRFLAPGGTFVCLDAELPLPFRDDEFAACLALDGLHYIRSKVALLKELDRVLDAGAIWLFPHMHNALQTNVAPGLPLSPSGWRRLLAFLPHRLLSEADVIAGFAERDACDLTTEAADTHFEASPTLAAVATRRVGFFRDHELLSDVVVDAQSALALNPLWKVERRRDGLDMTASWPSQELREECTLARSVLPESLALAAVDVARAGLDGASTPDRAFHRQLMRRCALVPLPPGYPRGAMGRRT